MSETTLESQAIQAAEQEELDILCGLSKHTIFEGWGWEREELEQLQFSEQGYLIAGIKSTRIIEHLTDDDGEEWSIGIIADVGVPSIELDESVYRVYQSADKSHWIVDHEN